MRDEPPRRAATSAAILTHAARPRVAAVPGTVVPERLLQLVADRPGAVMAPHRGAWIVACDPAETVRGADVWDALGAAPHEDPLAPAGGWIALLAYDLGGTIERLPAPRRDPGGPPQGWAGRYDTVAVVHADGRCEVRGVGSAAAVRELVALAERAGDAPAVPAVAPAAPPASSLPPCSYLQRVGRIRDLIRVGDCYQVNLAQRLRAPWPHDATAFAVRLWAAAGASSHRAYLALPEGTLVSASPERLVVVEDGVAVSEPIKGTAAPGEAAALARSAKDRAEHVMIVDLVRNDLGRVARIGGVSVPDLVVPLPTPYVEHLVSRVRAELRPGTSPATVLRAVFPGGSVTGCPKVRAMEVIRDLEPVSRGPAYGSLAVAGRDGSVEASVLIRTAWLSGGEVRYWSGGAVTWDSDPTAEHAEAMAKARPFMEALGCVSSA